MSLTASTRVGVRLALLFVVALVAAPGAQDRLAQDLAQPLDYVPGEVFVKFVPGTPLGIANQALAHLTGRRLGRFDRIGVEHWRAGKGVSTEQALDALARPPFRDWVEYAEPNYVRHTYQAYPDDPLRGDLWSFLNFKQTGGTKGADIAAIGTWGSQGTTDVIVAVIDTGVDYNHPDLAANVWNDGNGHHGKDFVNGDDDPLDDNGHGTHVSGTIAAVAGNGIGVVGVSWRAKIMALKFLNAGGSGSDANAISAINWARNNGARIMNASWGGGPKSTALSEAIRTCDCLFVASAGNSGNSKVNYPAGYTLDNIVSVAATDHNDALATFSSYGSAWVDLAAPGVNIFSTYRNGAYTTMSGTSMAAPHVTGTAALVLANEPGLATSALKSRILDNADRLGSLAGKVLTGARLNAARALDPQWTRPAEESVAPGAVLDLAAAPGPPNSLALSWTAPGDDGADAAAYLYDIRYSKWPITKDNWAAATPVTGEPCPASSGSSESFTLENLDASTEYYVGIKAIDEWGNVSELGVPSWARTQDGPRWAIESIVDPLGVGTSSYGFYHALAFRTDGEPLVAFSRHDGNTDSVRFAIRGASGWSVYPVEAGGPGIDLALGVGDQPAISHGWGKLRYAEGMDGGTSWLSRVIEAGPKNDFTSLVFKGDEPWIAYWGGGNVPPLKLIHGPGSSWVAQVVDSSGAGRYVSLAFDPGGYPAVAYSFDEDSDGWLDTLRFAHWNGTSWNVTNVEAGVRGYGVFPSLAYDRNGNPAIVHSSSFGVRIVRSDGTAWHGELVTADGRNASLAFDGQGVPMIAYSTNDDKLWWAWLDQSGVWQKEVVDRNADVVALASLKIDGAGNPAILYAHYLGKELRLARRIPQ